MVNRAGSIVGHYELLEQIGRGGMAVVYRARQTSIGREVAVKVLLASLVEEDSTVLDRFDREVQIVAQLQHPHILPVYDYGQADGIPFIVMAYLNGGSLAERITQSGPMGLLEVSDIVGQMAEALDYAHSQGIIHRDVKPGNVLFDLSGNAYLTDFGLARSVGSSHLTASASLIGTPDYMAPDWSGNYDDITHAADIYSLGVMVYQMLAGEVPYRSSSPMGVLMAHIQNPIPDICEKRPDLPIRVQTVIDRAMAKRPIDRFSSAGELAAALSEAARTPDIQPCTPSATCKSAGPYFYPNTWGRQMMITAREVLGEAEFNVVLDHAGVNEWNGYTPPDNWHKEVPFESIGQIWHAIYHIYGSRGIRSVGRVAGARVQQRSFEQYKGMLHLAEKMHHFAYADPSRRIRHGLGDMARIFNTFSDQVVEIQETDDAWLYRVIRCPICMGWTAEEPVCYLIGGMLEGGLKWASEGHEYRVVETECIARGDSACTFRIDKTPIR